MQQKNKDEKFSKELIMKLFKSAFTLGSNYVAFPEEDFETELNDMADYLLEKHEETKVSVGAPAIDDTNAPVYDAQLKGTPIYVNDLTIDPNKVDQNEELMEKVRHELLIRESTVLFNINEAKKEIMADVQRHMESKFFEQRFTFENLVKGLIKTHLNKARGEEFMKKNFGINMDEGK